MRNAQCANACEQKQTLIRQTPSYTVSYAYGRAYGHAYTVTRTVMRTVSPSVPALHALHFTPHRTPKLIFPFASAASPSASAAAQRCRPHSPPFARAFRALSIGCCCFCVACALRLMRLCSAAHCCASHLHSLRFAFASHTLTLTPSLSHTSQYVVLSLQTLSVLLPPRCVARCGFLVRLYCQHTTP